MGREVKRVPLDFSWPMNKIWPGYTISLYISIKHYYPDEHEELLKEFAKAMKCEYDDASDLTDEKYDDFKIEVPEGKGWQMWETVSEGSPISPVFKTPEELAQWLADTKSSAFGSQTATYEQWLAMIGEGWCVSGAFVPGKGVVSGVELASMDRKEVT